MRLEVIEETTLRHLLLRNEGHPSIPRVISEGSSRP
jgi:hypothetical protein